MIFIQYGFDSKFKSFGIYVDVDAVWLLKEMLTIFFFKSSKNFSFIGKQIIFCNKC